MDRAAPDDSDLARGLDELARTPTLLVACDYDGTLAPIVSDPMRAVPLRETSVALRSLAELPRTHVAVISGRALRDLAALSRLPAEIHLVGSHGTEFDIDFALALDADLRDRLTQLVAGLEPIRAETPGVILEKKPTSVAVHYRNAPEDAADELVRHLVTLADEIGGLTVRHGKKVCELLLIPTDKGNALNTMRSRVGATAVLFLGDDVTDEDAFATLAGPDIGVKVGDGETLAPYRIGSTDDVAVLLASLGQRRGDWLAGAGLVPIEDHSLLSDQRTAAIVAPNGRVTWMCVPRIDSAAMFAELVGGPSAGYFSVRPAESDSAPTQSYLDATMILRTSWSEMSVTDYLDCSNGRPSRLPGRTDLVRVVEGRGRAIIEFAPRLDFGRFPTQLELREGGIEVTNSSDLVVLRAPDVTWTIENHGTHQSAWAEVGLDAGPVTLELRCGTASLRAESRETDRRESTASFWRDWAGRLQLPSVEPELVRRSAIVLKALCSGPTGAIIAAPTTSLPESLGGVRNWDYRYCWIRDASLTAGALVRLGSTDEAMNLLDWLLRVIDNSDVGPSRLSPLYSVNGTSLPSEATIEELPGYAGSRPVRIGNAADHQVQLDVFGPVLQLVRQLGEAGAPLSARHWRLVEDLVSAVEHRWQEPDQGIWEIRAAPRHHVYSKAMCWLTVECALFVATEVFGRDRTEWKSLRATIADDVLTNGWNAGVGAFTAAYGAADLDASVLALGLVGLIDPDDHRYRSTVDTVETWLRDGPTVRRYNHDDGLPGVEGGFNLMTSWLIDAKIILGEVASARELFDEYVGLVGSTGLLSEEYDPATGRAMGNHPQAYSHLGLINNACNLDAAR